jgi:hypothetical protein
LEQRKQGIALDDICLFGGLLPSNTTHWTRSCSRSHWGWLLPYLLPSWIAIWAIHLTDCLLILPRLCFLSTTMYSMLKEYFVHLFLWLVQLSLNSSWCLSEIFHQVDILI